MKLSLPFHRFLFTFSCVLLFQLTHAQNYYVEGFVIKLSGEHLTGQIDLKSWVKNPKTIRFKKSNSDNAIDLSPFDIKGFKVKDESYESAIIWDNRSSSKVGSLSNSSELELKSDTVFLEAIVSADIGLYKLKNDLGIENYYYKKDDQFQLLEYKKYQTIDEKGRKLVENNKYIGQLNYIFRDCPNISSELNGIDYTRQKLEKIFISYNKCVNKDIVQHKKTDRLIRHFGMFAGVSVTSIEFLTSEGIFSTNYSTSVDPSLGIYFDLIFKKFKRRLSFYTEIASNKYEIEGTYTDVVHEDNYVVHNTEILMIYLKWNAMFRYKYPIGKNAHIYLNSGASFGLPIISTNKDCRESVFFTTTREDTIPLFRQGSRLQEFSYLLGGGLLYKKFQLDLRFERGSGVSPYNGLNSKMTRYYCQLGYHF